MKIIHLEEIDRPELRELEYRNGFLEYLENGSTVAAFRPRTPYELTWYNSAKCFIVVFDEDGVCYGFEDGYGTPEQQLIELLKTDMDVQSIMGFIDL